MLGCLLSILSFAIVVVAVIEIAKLGPSTRVPKPRPRWEWPIAAAYLGIGTFLLLGMPGAAVMELWPLLGLQPCGNPGEGFWPTAITATLALGPALVTAGAAFRYLRQWLLAPLAAAAALALFAFFVLVDAFAAWRMLCRAA